MKRKIRYMAYSAIYTARIHANVLCRLRFLAIKAIAKPEYWPAHHKGALHANIAVCSERAFMSGRARPGESRKGISKQCQNAIISS